MRSLVIVVAAVLLIPLEAAEAQQRPPTLEVQFSRAEAAWKTGASLHEAKARVDRVIDELPDDAQARKLRAQVLSALNRPGDALTDALKAAELAPDDAEARLILCEVAIAADELVLAVRELDAAAERVLDDPILNLRLSINALALGQLERAEAFARTAYNLAPRNPQVHYQLARVFVRRGMEQEAAAILSRGFQSTTLNSGLIRTDSLLRRVANHPELRDLLVP